MNKISRKIVAIVITLVIMVGIMVIIGAFTPAPILAPIPALTPDAPVPPVAQCRATGCSSQVCADEDVITTCEFRPEFACYRNARCERQENNQCEWTATPELNACLAALSGE